MSLTPVVINRFQTGFDTYDQPEIMPNDGFPTLEDVICFRGVLRKRDGFELLGTVPNTGTITLITNFNPGQVTTSAPHNLSTGQQVLITGVTGMTQVNSSTIPYTITVTGPQTFTIGVDTSTFGAYIGGGIVSVPIMGLETRLSSAFFEDLIAFTENQAYLFNAGAFSNISGATTWTGADFNFFQSTNYFGSFWASNNIDPIRYYISGVVWTNFTPQIDAAGNTLQKGFWLFPYRNRLVILNTTEAGQNFPQRARWSQNGTPYVGAPTPVGVSSDIDAWRQDIAGKGGFIDAPTSEKIVSAGFIRDTLVVMFDSSAWRLSYTGNEILPFIWERINSQLGAEAPASGVVFDEGFLSVGRRGICVTDTNSSKRIEDRIVPDQVFQMDVENNNNQRIQGIRDYEKLLVYWTYVQTSDVNTTHYPNKVLVYNYIDNNWAIFNQTFTTYGQYREVNDITWAEDTNEWQNESRFWNSGNLQIGNATVVAGDQLGNVYLFTPDINDDNSQAFNFNILTKKFNPFIDQLVQAKAIYMHILISGNSGGQITLNHFIDENPDAPIESITIPTNTISQEKVWRRVNLSGISQFHQFQITFTSDQLSDTKIPFEDYQIFQIIFEFAPGGRLNYGDFTT